jgi:FtsP/CotA-like multicopper oxidase with cupredoxin domain
MANLSSLLDRRELVAGLGAVAFRAALPNHVSAEPLSSLALYAKTDDATLAPKRLDTLFWWFKGSALNEIGRSKSGYTLKFAFLNELAVPAVLDWHGVDGFPELLLWHPNLPTDNGQIIELPFRQAGTSLLSLRLLGDGQGRPSRALPFIVEENEVVLVDRDEVVLIEDWRLQPDGTAVAPGSDPADAKLRYTINGQPSLYISARANERVRFRFINGCQRTVIAVKLENLDVWIMALDSQPAEPFQARNSALVIPPRGRVDAFVDATLPIGAVSQILLHDGNEPRLIGEVTVSNGPPMRNAPLPPAPPLPSNGLPAQLDLKNALRVDLTLGGSRTDWMKPADFVASSAPAFRGKAGRTVVLALTNRAAVASVFHLHGHHFRLLDRLDDGWKPFWLDTLAIESGQTQRVAFAAEYAGRWLMETTATDWTAPRLLRWYSVE